MSPGEWIALIAFTTGIVSGAFAFLNRKIEHVEGEIDRVEERLEEHANATVKDLWERAEKRSPRPTKSRLDKRINALYSF